MGRFRRAPAVAELTTKSTRRQVPNRKPGCPDNWHRGDWKCANQHMRPVIEGLLDFDRHRQFVVHRDESERRWSEDVVPRLPARAEPPYNFFCFTDRRILKGWFA